MISLKIFNKNRKIALVFNLFALLLITTFCLTIISTVSAEITSEKNETKNAEPNYTITYFDKSAAVKGDVLKNKKISKYMPKTNLSKKIVSMCKKGSVIIKIGKGKPKLLITAGIHGSEPGANIATLRFIEKIKNKKINGSIYIIPFLIPKDTSLNKRVWYNPKTKSSADPNRISNKVGTPGYKVVQFAKKNNITSIIDVHTGYGLSGYKNGFIFANKNPTKKEKQWIKYIKKNANPYIQYNFPKNGMVRSYSRNNGIDTLTLEVEISKGSCSHWANIEYKMLYSAVKYFKIF